MFRYEITAKCKVCGKCAKRCPAQAISRTGRLYEIDQEKCIHCGACYDRCSKGAIRRLDSDGNIAQPTPRKGKKGRKRKRGLWHRLRRLLGLE